MVFQGRKWSLTNARASEVIVEQSDKRGEYFLAQLPQAFAVDAGVSLYFLRVDFADEAGEFVLILRYVEPSCDHCRVNLQMKLEGVDVLAKAKSLIWALR